MVLMFVNIDVLNLLSAIIPIMFIGLIVGMIAYTILDKTILKKVRIKAMEEIIEKQKKFADDIKSGNIKVPPLEIEFPLILQPGWLKFTLFLSFLIAFDAVALNSNNMTLHLGVFVAVFNLASLFAMLNAKFKYVKLCEDEMIVKQWLLGKPIAINYNSITSANYRIERQLKRQNRQVRYQINHFIDIVSITEEKLIIYINPYTESQRRKIANTILVKNKSMTCNLELYKLSIGDKINYYDTIIYSTLSKIKLPGIFKENNDHTDME